ncbi:MAG: alkaline phosphatase family protein [Bryobacteraceae bacterium]
MRRTSAALLVCAICSFAQTADRPVRAVTDPGIVTTRQAITPAGVSSIFQGRVYGASWDQSGDRLWVLHASEVYGLDWRNNKIVTKLKHGGAPGAQAIGVTAPDSLVLVANSVRGKERSSTPEAQLLAVKDGNLRVVASGLGKYQPGAFATARKGSLAVLPLVWENKAIVVDLNTGKTLVSARTGTAPWAAAVNESGTVAYVSNLGGRPAKAGEAAASPKQKPEEMIPIDVRGIASTGTITRIDVSKGEATHTIQVGLHPTALALDEKRRKLFVANGNSDSVSVIDTESNSVVRTIDIQFFGTKVKGVAPTALALSTDGKLLYVACGGINAVAVVDTEAFQLKGLIPSGWYPNSVSVSPDGKNLAVTSLLGAGSGWRDEPGKRFVHAYRGSVNVLPVPDEAQLASYTTAVAENNHLRLASASTPRETARAGVKPVAIPVRSGEPSLIEHVVYIIKENRTYDQVLGALPQGNGDPSLVMFGRSVTPNQHRLAEQFVLLDNTYATGGNSGDGHQWATQANETEYCLWPGYQGRSYPFDGSDPMAYSSGGFIWDYALARGKSVKVYGEYAGRMDDPPAAERQKLLARWKQGEDFSRAWSIRAPIEPLNKILAANYPSYTNAIPDVIRAQIFLRDLAEYQKNNSLPNLVILQLPCDHTYGTRAGISTPSAMVADNDLAVGHIVEALSKSRFWPKMAIFIIEDDAQNGVDHVDGHRMPAFVASPYARRGHVDSTFYSHQSVLKTIELILGLPTMSIFDLIAHDMRASFADTPDLAPFQAAEPEHDLFEVNPPVSALRGKAREGALASARMNWSVPDAVPTERLNRIVWGQIKGWNTAYPAPRRAVFSPLEIETEDKDREERDE